MPGFPHHVMQREHDRKVIFRSANKRLAYLTGLCDLRRELDCKVYGYCLMANHVHLIVDPGDRAGNMSLFMGGLASLSGHSTRLVRRPHSPSTSLKNRFKVVPIESDDYLLACARYLDLNPVRAKIVTRPEDYHWSSYRSRIGLSSCPWLDTDPCFLSLGENREEQQRRYREFVEGGIRERQLQSARIALW